ncbi:LexA family transcriptional regulator [Spiribacter halobius]|uniref:HTH cro/C1-type domain-containing protein n=1 Tax=Sediminicurvatus halobius TaxID=2182432 RepID=A0A2U2MYG2_9GAMM|nr:XRE family transcriptional regulator [Spiribacter halobius]PWG61744.1 hypothetical protein DEM34_14865 [Spiribacter halobius]UEX76825.1 XRE family transcriptional regulator [Spiribacter halobius]
MTEKTNHELAENIRWAMQQAGVRSVDVANALGVSEQAVYGWRKTGKISRANLVRLARYLQVPADQIQPPGEIIEVMSSSRETTLPKELEPMVVAEDAGPYFDEPAFLRRSEPAYPLETGPAIRGEIPLIGWDEAGRWRGVHEDTRTEETIIATRKVSPDAFALRVQDDTNSPDIPRGAIVVVDPDVEPRHEHYVIALLPGSDAPTLKQLIVDGDQQYLRPRNDRYPIQPFPPGGRIIGVVRQAVQDFF